MEEALPLPLIITENQKKMNQKRIFLVSLIGIATLLSCTKAEKKNDFQTIKTNSGEWELIWDEEFDYTGLPDSAKWSYDVDGNSSGWGNNEKQYYTKADKRNAWVQDGFLTITALKDTMDGKPYTSARLRTRGKGDWLYGRFEIKAQNPSGLGTWPAIWMLPTDWAYGGWPASGEIDIMENVGYDPDSIVGSAHTLTYNHLKGTQKSAKIFCPSNFSESHVYALEWETDEYRLYFDDVKYFTFKKEGNNFEIWPFDKPFHILLNLAIGGNWGGKMGIDDTLFPHKLKVDYVRVYKKK